MNESMVDIAKVIGAIIPVGGFLGYVKYTLGRQQKEIDDKVSIQLHTEVCGEMSRKVEEFQGEQKEMRGVLGDVREAVARIDERTKNL